MGRTLHCCVLWVSALYFVFPSRPRTGEIVLRENREAGLEASVTDASFQALAEAGCGNNLTSLYLEARVLYASPLLLLCLLALDHLPMPSAPLCFLLLKKHKKRRPEGRRHGRQHTGAGKGGMWREPDVPAIFLCVFVLLSPVLAPPAFVPSGVMNKGRVGGGSDGRQRASPGEAGVWCQPDIAQFHRWVSIASLSLAFAFPTHFFPLASTQQTT